MEVVLAIEMVLYFLFIIGIGLIFSRKKMGRSEFLLGGKKLPGWALAFSERATSESSWLLLGFTGFTFLTGLSAIWTIVGMVLGISFTWLVLAKKFMIETDKHKVLTLTDYLAARFPNHGVYIRIFATALILIFFIFYVGAQYDGIGKTFFTIFNLTPTAGVIISTIVVIAIAFSGGFISVVWTDMIQSIMMLIVLGGMPIIALIHILTHDISIIHEMQAAGNGVDTWTGGVTGFAFGLLFFNNFSYFFGYLGGQPQLSARFMALRSEKDAKVASITGIVWTLIAFFGAFFIGIMAIALYNINDFADEEVILPTMILDLTPSWIAGILISGIIAAMITTATSQIMVVTSSISEDLMNKSFKIQLSETKWVLISRIVIIITGLLALLMAVVSKSLVLTVVGWAWAGVGSTLSVAVLLTFFWKRYSGIGVIATIISGLVGTLIWINSPLDDIISARFSTFFIALFFGVTFSLLFPEKRHEEGKGDEAPN
ncbi:sodium:proline symporter [Lentibacillus kapialis]|uniref:Sodium/proline symporter n=1 Tax=Lentibacillus kapialis TaxID=340214 RepID=A0A917UYP8_9BACI|nr:sodium/proline symporter [Lentibacillus kapialis]GGJ99864.1 sodium:proline symporter [Lentibacillus kapialis]